MIPRNFFRRGMVALVSAVLGPCAVLAHPIHRSIAEATYQRDRQELVVALRVYVDDFEGALGSRTKKEISLEKTPADEFNALARGYVSETFTVKSSDGRPAELRWIRREHKPAENELWLHFVVSLPSGIERTRIRHAVLADHFRDQLNSVLVRDGERKVTLVFLPNHGEKAVVFRP